MLVPTTILAQQHYGTFSERLADYPFTLEHVSRFRTRSRAESGVKGFAEGRVDILIGTHRVLSRDVRAKDLGLLIIDEEQRFGVKQKELLRQLQAEGRRDLDVRHADPAHAADVARRAARHLGDRDAAGGPAAGRTYVGEYEEELVQRAIERERARGGQAFFLHNRVESIEETAERLRALCPGARFAVAHGQMAEGELEAVMIDYLRGDADVLVCTSIIESGIDIPQANTLIVERADTFGLAQLYQIRGRVGRSRERAYAYLLYDSAAALTPEAAQRLSALSDSPSSAPASRSRCATSRSAAPATCSGRAVRPRRGARVRALHADARRGGRARREPEARGRVAARAGSPGRRRRRLRPGRLRPLRAGQDRRPPAPRRRASRSPTSSACARSSRTASARFPSRVENLLSLQRARIKFGQAGARTVSFRGDRLAVVPIELDSARARRLREELPEALYESGRSQVSCGSRKTGGALPDVVSAADALLAVVREAA